MKQMSKLRIAGPLMISFGILTFSPKVSHAQEWASPVPSFPQELFGPDIGTGPIQMPPQLGPGSPQQLETLHHPVQSSRATPVILPRVITIENADEEDLSFAIRLVDGSIAPFSIRAGTSMVFRFNADATLVLGDDSQ